MKLQSLLLLAFCGSIAVAQEPNPDDELYALDQAERLNSNEREPEPKYPDGVNTIPGEAELNYPVYNSIMKTSFSCIGRPAGFYADLEARCQVWHICDVDERMQSFLCTNGTIFSQSTRVCEWWYNTNCDANEVEKEYEHNRELYQVKDLDKLREAKETQDRPKSQQRGNAEEERYRPAPQQEQRRENYNAPQQQQQQPRRENNNEQPQQRPVQQQQPAQPSRPQEAYPEKPLTLNLQQKFKVSSDPRSNDFAAPNNAFRPESQQQQPRPTSQQQQQPRPTQQQQPRPTPQQQPEPNVRQTGQYREESYQRPTQQPQQLSREELEARRLAARDEFYSTAARKQQENRINQTPPNTPVPAQRQYVAESRNENQAVEQRRPSKEYNPDQSRPRNEEQAPAKKKPVNPDYVPGAPPQAIKPKFRHSTPRKHNVHFAASAPRSQTQFEDERQIPEETQQKGFPFYNYNPRQFQEYAASRQQSEAPTARRVPAPEPTTTTERVNTYLPTPREILREAPTYQPEVEQVKRRPGRRRKDPKRIAAIRAERERQVTSTTAKPFVFVQERPRITAKPFAFVEDRPRPRPVSTTPTPVPITTTSRRPPIPKVTLPAAEFPQVSRGPSINGNPKYSTFPVIPRRPDTRVKSDNNAFPEVKNFNANQLRNDEDPRLVVRPKNSSAARVVVKRKLRNKTLTADHRRAFVQNNDVVTEESVEERRQKDAVETRVQNDFTQVHAPVKRCAVSGEGNSFKILC